jgi:DNA-binding CsgD family transcriptional regulator
MHSFLQASENINLHLQPLNNQIFQDLTQFDPFVEVVEYFVDGILILTQQGNKIYANSRADKICQHFFQERYSPNAIPREILQPCQEFAKLNHSSSQPTIVSELEIATANSGLFRLRVQQFSLDNPNYYYLLVIIEDRHQSLQNLVKLDAYKYGLTRSEEKVWLLRTAKYTYKQIAATLCITLNTVKKHMKNIHAKRQAVINFEE